MTMSMLVTLALLAQPAGSSDELVRYLEAEGLPPADYILSKFDDHRVVILGEAHWIKHDVELVSALIPRLADAGVDLFATELLPAEAQELVTEVVAADRWNPAAAMAVMRADPWPYREYMEILHAAWSYNAELGDGGKPLEVLALGPGNDWREKLLPLGRDYDEFMAQRVLERLGSDRRALVYVGAHHAFTRYTQPELPGGERVERVQRFMDRMGNQLWRELGEDVFQVALHRPWQYRAGERWSYRMPLDGRIDCAAVALNRPIGFDIVGSPFAELRLLPETYYAMGYPDLRLGDFADGYVWTSPIQQYEGVALIPLAEFAPDDETLAQVAAENPFSEERGLDRPALEALWSQQDARLHDPAGWSFLFGWRDNCGNGP